MHQSFVTPAAQGTRNSWDIDFSLCKARVYALNCGGNFLVKSPQIAPAPPKLFRLLLARLYLAGNQKSSTNTALLGHRKGKIMLLIPRSPWHFPGPKEAELQMTGALFGSNSISRRLSNSRYTTFHLVIYVYSVSRKRPISAVHKINTRIRQKHLSKISSK